MENIEICCSHNVGIDGKDFTPECDCSCHQPIEEKWKGSWRWRSDRMGLDKDQHDEILDFIENLLEQEKREECKACLQIHEYHKIGAKNETTLPLTSK